MNAINCRQYYTWYMWPPNSFTFTHLLQVVCFFMISFTITLKIIFTNLDYNFRLFSLQTSRQLLPVLVVTFLFNSNYFSFLLFFNCFFGRYFLQRLYIFTKFLVFFFLPDYISFAIVCNFILIYVVFFIFMCPTFIDICICICWPLSICTLYSLSCQPYIFVYV